MRRLGQSWGNWAQCVICQCEWPHRAERLAACCKWKIRFAAAANFTFRFGLDERRVLLGLVSEFMANRVPSSNRFWHAYEVGIGKQGSYFAVSGEYALFMEYDDRLSHLFTYLCFTFFSSLPAVHLSSLSK